MPLLCRLGWHRWKKTLFVGAIRGTGKTCRRCPTEVRPPIAAG